MTGPARHVGKLFLKSNAMGDRAVQAGVPTRTATNSDAVANAVLPAGTSGQPWAPGLSRKARQRPVEGDSRRSNIQSEVLSRPASGLGAAAVPKERRFRDPGTDRTGSTLIPRALEAAGLPPKAAVPGPAAVVPDRALRDPTDQATASGTVRYPDIADRIDRGAGTLPAPLRAAARRDEAPAYAQSWQPPSPGLVPDADANGRQQGFTALPDGSTRAIMPLGRMIPMASRAALAVEGAEGTMELQRRVVPPPTSLARPTASSAAEADRHWLARPSGHDPGPQAPDGQGGAPGMPLVVHLTGDVMLDGRRLGQLTASSQARQASLPSHGTSRVDLRAVPIYSGAQVPR